MKSKRLRLKPYLRFYLFLCCKDGKQTSFKDKTKLQPKFATVTKLPRQHCGAVHVSSSRKNDHYRKVCDEIVNKILCGTVGRHSVRVYCKQIPHHTYTLTVNDGL